MVRFDPDEWFLVVTRRIVTETCIGVDEIRKRVCSPRSMQLPRPTWKAQPAVIVDDGRIKWTVTFGAKTAPDGKKRVCYVVEADRYHEEP